MRMHFIGGRQATSADCQAYSLRIVGQWWEGELAIHDDLIRPTHYFPIDETKNEL